MTAPAMGADSGHPTVTSEGVPVPAPTHPHPHAPLGSWGKFVATISGIRLLRLGWVVVRTSLRNAWQHRILGLAAEAAFWQLISLPSLAFALIGMLGYLGRSVGADTIARIRTNILDSASNSLTPDTVDSLVKPLLDGVLNGHRAGIISIGFLVSLWSGSSAMATFVNTITISYDQRELRGAVASRFLALGLYIASMLITIITLPVLVLGPSVIRSWPVVKDHPTLDDIVRFSYWPVVVMLCVAALCTLYHLAVPRRPRWRDTIPGAVAAATLWIVGAIGLRAYITWVFHRTLDYGALAAPVAILAFCYLTALAVLLGAEINAELDRMRAARTARLADQRLTLEE